MRARQRHNKNDQIRVFPSTRIHQTRWHPLPTDVAFPERLDGNTRLPTRLPEDVPFQDVMLIGLRGQLHRLNVVGTRIGGDGMLAALPDAGGEVEPRLRVWDAVPV